MCCWCAGEKTSNTQHTSYQRAQRQICLTQHVFRTSTAQTRKWLSYVNICKKHTLRMFHGVVWNHTPPPKEYAHQRRFWSSGRSSHIWCCTVIVQNILNVTLPFHWTHPNRRPSIAFRLTHKPGFMICNIALWIIRNTREGVFAGFLALVPLEKRTAH